jgi:hypothetical protein
MLLPGHELTALRKWKAERIPSQQTWGNPARPKLREPLRIPSVKYRSLQFFRAGSCKRGQAIERQDLTASCMTLDESLNLPVPHFSHLQNGSHQTST